VLLALLAHGHRLVLADGMRPFVRLLGIERRRPAHEDLHRSLVCVLRVVGAQRVAPRGAQQRVGVLRDHAQDELMRARCFDIHVVPHPLLEVRLHPPF
jgi:hypothetical protein